MKRMQRARIWLGALLICGLFAGCAAPVDAATLGNAAKAPATAGNAVEIAAAPGGPMEVTATMGNAVEASVYKYTVVDLGVSEESYESAPREKAIPVQDAARSGLTLLLGAFGDDVPKGGTVYVSFYNIQDVAMELYHVSIDAPIHGDPPFYAQVNAHDGTALYATRFYEPGEPVADPAAFDWDDYDNEDIVAKTYAAAVALATDIRFTRKNEQAAPLQDSYIDGVQATFRTVDPVCADAYLHMDDGNCYSMRIEYPSMTVTNVILYPDWAHCQQGTIFDEYLTGPGAADAPSAGDSAPTPPPAVMGEANAEGPQIDDENYRLIALTVEAMVGDEYTADDLSLKKDAAFTDVCAAWTDRVLFTLAIPDVSVGQTDTVALTALTDPALKPGMQVLWTYDGDRYIGFYLGNGDAVSLTRRAPYTVRRIDLAALVDGGSATELARIALYQGA